MGDVPVFKLMVVIKGGVAELFVGIMFWVGVVDTLELRLEAELEFVDSLGLFVKFSVGNVLRVLWMRLLTIG